MTIESFLEMFKEETDLEPRKLLRAYLRRHIKNDEQMNIKQPKVLEIRNLTWNVAIQLNDFKLITHFIYDKMSFNPGKTGLGLSNEICATTIYRNQWDKVNGAPN